MPKHSTPRKPKKPYPDFPLFPHASGQWAKKIRGKMRYFGKWEDPDAALHHYTSTRDDLYAGREPREEPVDGLTLADAVNHFLTSKWRQHEAGELTLRTFHEYKQCAEQLVNVLGRDRLVADLRPADFDRVYGSMTKLDPVTRGNRIVRMRAIFNHALHNDLIDRPVKFGTLFRQPSKKKMRQVRASKPSKVFTAAEIRALLDAADPVMAAAVLLGINAGFGPADISDLQFRHLDLDGGYIDMPRGKTGIERRCKLWPETIAALQQVIDSRRDPKSKADADIVFITGRGQRFERYSEHEDGDRGVKVSAFGAKFRALKKAAGVKRPGVGLYGLRHTLETIGGQTADQVMLDRILGHVDPSMGANYREHLRDAEENRRLTAIADHVHKWLWP